MYPAIDKVHVQTGSMRRGQNVMTLHKLNFYKSSIWKSALRYLHLLAKHEKASSSLSVQCSPLTVVRWSNSIYGLSGGLSPRSPLWSAGQTLVTGLSFRVISRWPNWLDQY